jgi:CRISPR-associated endonuclease/helicase Cas3
MIPKQGNLRGTIIRPYLLRWGKASPTVGSTFRWHPFAYHSLDVAAVTYAYLEANPSILTALAAAWQLDCRQTLNLATFLAGCHDVGKLSNGFQSIDADVYALLQPGMSLVQQTTSHSTLGLSTLILDLAARWSTPASRDFAAMVVTPLANAACGHHGQPENASGAPMHSTEAELVRQFIDDLDELLGTTVEVATAWPALLGSSADIRAFVRGRPFANASWLLAGVITVCDWVGSNQESFPYEAPTLSMAEYWAVAKRRAERAVLDTCLAQKAPSRESGFDWLFGEAAVRRARQADSSSLTHEHPKVATPLQRFANRVKLPERQQPGLFILEDETGAGKTEAALTLASRLVSNGTARGVFFALPTQTTADAVYLRVRPVVAQFFESGQAPTLTLAHGHARHTLARLAAPTRVGDITSDLRGWAGDSSKTALLTDFGVGTVDQVAMTVLPIRHVVLRQAGLVVDEAHAYDAYLLTLLCTALTAHARNGGSAVILSATLPLAVKQKLVDAFCAGRSLAPAVLTATHYPLATAVMAASRVDGEHELRLQGTFLLEEPIEARKEPRKALFVPILEKQEFGLVQDWVKQGRCVCLLRNTVSRAQAAYDEYNAHFPGQVMLAHARFVVGHRGENDEQLLSRFGPKSGPEQRRGCIVIATQVAEQSLDVDFDEMVSDIAPIDSLLQRRGRLHRHVRNSMGERSDAEGRPATALHVIAPAADCGDQFLVDLPRGTRFVYTDVGVLYRTSHIIHGQEGFDGTLTIPNEVRRAVEYAYDEAACVPYYLADDDGDAQSKKLAQENTAVLRSLQMNLGYVSESGTWSSVDSVTRLGEPSVRIVLADSTGKPLFGDEVLSSIAVRLQALRGAQLPPSSSGSPGLLRVSLTLAAPGCWNCQLVDNKGKSFVLEYRRSTGLHFSK